jgi:MFS family permease
MTTPTSAPVDRRAWITLAVASVSSFMVSLEITVISLAFRKIVSAFPDTPPTTLSWVFTAYNITVASLLLISGWLADTRGRKRCFLLGLAIFGSGSVVSGLATSGEMLISGRVFQGVGGALLAPAGLALVLTAFPPERRSAAVGIWGISGGLAAAVGPTAGAVLVQTFGWRAVFLINVPIAFAAIPIGIAYLVESTAPGVARNVDVVGAPLASLSVGMLVLAIVEGGRWGWLSGRTIGAGRRVERPRPVSPTRSQVWCVQRCVASAVVTLRNNDRKNLRRNFT